MAVSALPAGYLNPTKPTAAFSDIYTTRPGVLGQATPPPGTDYNPIDLTNPTIRNAAQSTITEEAQLQGTAAEDTASSQAQTIAATGATKEAEAYDVAGAIARAGQATTEESTRLLTLMTERDISRTLGKQSAEFGSSGFGGSSTGVSLMKSSAQQGALALSMVGAQGALEEGGFEEQAAAATTEATGARVQAGTATTLAAAYANAASSATDQANQLNASISQFGITQKDITAAALEGAAATAPASFFQSTNPSATGYLGYHW